MSSEENKIIHIRGRRSNSWYNMLEQFQEAILEGYRLPEPDILRQTARMRVTGAGMFYIELVPEGLVDAEGLQVGEVLTELEAPLEATGEEISTTPTQNPSEEENVAEKASDEAEEATERDIEGSLKDIMLQRIEKASKKTDALALAEEWGVEISEKASRPTQIQKVLRQWVEGQ